MVFSIDFLICQSNNHFGRKSCDLMPIELWLGWLGRSPASVRLNLRQSGSTCGIAGSWNWGRRCLIGSVRFSSCGFWRVLGLSLFDIGCSQLTRHLLIFHIHSSVLPLEQRTLVCRTDQEWAHPATIAWKGRNLWFWLFLFFLYFCLFVLKCFRVWDLDEQSQYHVNIGQPKESNALLMLH